MEVKVTENRLKEFRVKAGLSQVELARRAGIASTNLNAVECFNFKFK